MNTRLQQFLSAENISQAQFADTIEVARASVSHVLAGRNKPGYDFIKNIADHYPKLNLDWLINGKGKMYKEMIAAPLPSADYTDELFAPEKPVTVENPFRQTAEPPKIDASTESNIKTEASKIVNYQRKISKIIVFFDDDTFQELK